MNKIIGILLVMVTLSGCHKVAVPKPRGYFRIDLPEKSYTSFQNNAGAEKLPFTFEYPSYGKVTFRVEDRQESGWFNMEFPAFKAKIHFTYKDIRNDLDSLLEQTYKINVKYHITKADAINEQVIDNPAGRVFGVLYDLKGNTASAVQFYVTDSTRHYLRGSLYFNAEPDQDSLAPVIEFFRDDIIHMIETLKWNE